MRLGLEAGKDTIAAAIELGINGVPVNGSDIVENGIEAVLAPLKKAGLDVCQIGAFGFNPLSDDHAAQQAALTMMQALIPLVKQAGCPYVVICGGNHHPSGFGGYDKRNDAPDALDKIAAVLDPIVTLAAKNAAKISIEPYLKTTINAPEKFFELRAKISHPEALVANVDVTSLYDYRDYVAPDERCQLVCEGFAGAYGLGHIKDIALEDGFHLKMGLAPLGTSLTDWPRVLQMMEKYMPDDSWLILEHVADIEEARASVDKLRTYAKQAGVSLS